MFNYVLCANLGNIKNFNDLLYDRKHNSCNILKLNKVECRTENNQNYKIIKYDKDFLTFDLVNTYGLCRSIIINSDNKVIGFSPPKSLPTDTFITKYSDLNNNIIAQEFIEGTMINVFFDPTIGLNGGWEIATRNTIGATSTFYKSKTSKSFRSMFLEAAKECNLLFDNLNKNMCYSFVLQHPCNRIVVPFTKPQLYLVAIYVIDNSNKENILVYTYSIDDIINFDWIDTTIKFPEIYNANTYSELIEKYASMNTNYNILGFIMYNKITGERTKVRNPVYEQIRQLRGNQPKLQYQYLFLRKEGKVSDFLKFYPENKKEFSNFRDELHLFTNTLYKNYISCYIKKEKPLKEFSEQYRTHMFNIHQKYINELREQKLYVTNMIVINYVNELQPSLLMYCLNFHFRKRNIDIIVNDFYTE